ncbi:MAG: GTP 3',8-cyclase MoaA [Firmicutes bacterium]|nr:GTP 3',8-cyclase MoaA [Bacillota bacterium]
MPTPVLVDNYGRKIDYLRLSVTEQCNLSCFYCRSNPGECIVGTGDALSLQEFLAIGAAASELGFSRIRLTGGEPLIRKDLPEMVEGLTKLKGIRDLSLTTNGTLLPRFAQKLAEAGLKRINISLDSLDESSFQQITNGGVLNQVLEGIEAALQYGLTPVKINVVLLKGINDHEIVNFLKLTLEKEVDVRFIEYMPIGAQKMKWKDFFLPLERVLIEGKSLGEFMPIEGEEGGGPAQYYKIEGAKGKIGLITPLSRHFCDRCNRLRITFDGKIKPCLCSSEEYDLKPFLNDKVLLKKAFKKAVMLKPDPGQAAGDAEKRAIQYESQRDMTQIGG